MTMAQYFQQWLRTEEVTTKEPKYHHVDDFLSSHQYTISM